MYSDPYSRRVRKSRHDKRCYRYLQELSECRVSKTDGFLRFSFGRVHPSQGKRGSSGKTGFFCVFGGPETVLKTVLTIRFASYGRFFERGKMSENRQTTLKTGGFWRFFRVRSNPLRESGSQVSKTGVFLRFFFGRVHPSQGKQGSSVKNWVFFAFLGVRNVLTIRFALYGRFLTPSRGEKRWFQTTLKLEGSETICFSILGHPEPSSDGFRGISEWFQSGPKLCGFRGVPEWSETVFFLRLPVGQYGPVSQLSRSEERCTGPFNWGEAHCAGEKVKRKIGPFLRKSLKNQTRTRTQQKGAQPATATRNPLARLPGARAKEETNTTNKRLHQQILVRLNVLDLQWTIL